MAERNVLFNIGFNWWNPSLRLPNKELHILFLPEKGERVGVGAKMGPMKFVIFSLTFNKDHVPFKTRIET